MIGPLPTAPGGFNRVLVAIDKFTKWIEVKPVTCPKADRVLDFLDELVHRYGLPHRIIRLEVEVQPPPLKNFWRSWSASPLLQRRAEDPWPPPLERWWPRERRRRLRRPPPPWRRQ
jgi:hypothetical protein